MLPTRRTEGTRRGAAKPTADLVGCLDFAAIESGVFVASGWVSDDSKELSFALQAERKSVPLHSLESLRGTRKDAQKHLGNQHGAKLGFVLFADVEAELIASKKLVLTVSTGAGRLGLTFGLKDGASARGFQRHIDGYTRAEKKAAHLHGQDVWSLQ